MKKQIKHEKFVKAIKEAEKRAKQFIEHCESKGLKPIDIFILLAEQQKNRNEDKQQSRVYEKTDSQEANGWQRMEVRFGARKNKRKKSK